MNEVKLDELAGGVVQEKFNNAFRSVVENLQDVNTPYKPKREITIKLKFSQNESRNNVGLDVDVTTKLAPETSTTAAFYVGKDLKTGEVFAEEYGNQIRGQISIEDYADKQTIEEKTVDAETGEILSGKVVDLRARK